MAKYLFATAATLVVLVTSSTILGQTQWDVVATGLTNPRNMQWGPDGLLYVAEAGVGGSNPGTCEWEGNMFTLPPADPYMGGYSGRVSRILRDGQRETVVEGLPSSQDGFGEALGPSDLAWIGNELYVLIEGGGCTRGLPDDPAGIVRIERDGSYSYVADITAFVRANPVQAEPLCGPEGDCEPDGVPHAMLAHGQLLYVTETNHNSLLVVDPRTGDIQRLHDLSVEDPAPIMMARHGQTFFVGAFGGQILEFDRRFDRVVGRDEGYGAIVNMVIVGNAIYVLETFAAETPWTPETGRVVRRNPDGSRTVVADGLNFPIGMVRRGNALYVSTDSYGQGPGATGMGRIVRVALH